MKIEPDLAVSYEQPDDNTYIFKLRAGREVPQRPGVHRRGRQIHLRPHPGARQHQPAQGPLFQHQGGHGRRSLHGASSRLKAPDAAFLTNLATNPDGVIVAKGVDNLEPQPVGTGPFVFESYEPNQQFTLTANPELLREGQPQPARVIFKFYKDQAHAVVGAALQGDRHDLAQGSARSRRQIAKTSPDLVSAPGQTSRTFPVWLNMKATPLNDVRVRRALSLATDRKALRSTPCSAAPARSAR